MGENLHDFGFIDDISDTPPKTQSVNESKAKLDFIKI